MVVDRVFNSNTELSNLFKKREMKVTKTQRTAFDRFDVVHLASQKLRNIETPGNTTWRQYYIVAHTVGKENRKLKIMFFKM